MELKRTYRVFPSPEILADAFAQNLSEIIMTRLEGKPYFTLALSGGNTPLMLYSVLAEKFRDRINWQHIHIFWVDERCVPPDDRESNYGAARNILLNRITIPGKNIHRIRGEKDPAKEVIRYSEEVLEYTDHQEGYPAFDAVILGMGEDGHTASIFPDSSHLFDTGRICALAIHPYSGQKRITVTGKVINNAESVFFIVTGKNKAGTVEKIFKKDEEIPDFPAALVKPVKGTAEWWLDCDAATLVM